MATMREINARSFRPSSFSRNLVGSSSARSSSSHSIKIGTGGASFISSGIPDLDRILGGGFILGSVVMVMEDTEAPHHLLLIRNFMSQGLVHHQPLLFASPSADPRAFLGTLPAPLQNEKHAASGSHPDENGLRIAWQYKKYFEEQHVAVPHDKDFKQAYSSDFDLRKPLDEQFLHSQQIDFISTQPSPNLSVLHDRCSSFLSKFSRIDNSGCLAGRIAILSLCAPQCGYLESDWDMVSFIRSLRGMVRSSNAVAMVTFPSSMLSSSFCKRWQHLADTLLSVCALPDEDKDLAKLLTGYQDMVGLLHVHRVAQVYTQVPMILDASTYSLKLQKRRSLALERLNQAPLDGGSGGGDGGGCSGSSFKGSPLDF